MPIKKEIKCFLTYLVSPANTEGIKNGNIFFSLEQIIYFINIINLKTYHSNN